MREGPRYWSQARPSVLCLLMRPESIMMYTETALGLVGRLLLGPDIMAILESDGRRERLLSVYTCTNVSNMFMLVS